MHSELDIVIPCLTDKATFTRCLSSFENQTNQRFRLIVVDDGVQYSLKEIASSSSLEMHVLTSCAENVSIARNIGLSAVTAPIVTFVDADDTVSRDFVDKILATFQASNADVEIFSIEKKKQEHTIVVSPPVGLIKTDNALVKFYSDDDNCRIIGSLHGKAFRSSIAKRLAFDEKAAVGEDALYLIQAIVRSRNIVGSECVIYNRFYNEQSVLSKLHTEKYRKAIVPSIKMAVVAILHMPTIFPYAIRNIFSVIAAYLTTKRVNTDEGTRAI